ncbi:DUF397 domain-containing protein [Streptomyces sp. p1417]|uniref:DUF397 domain-containing protein n=1 Tax=Streptomyces typhae TaxID=2681492 RepID=A0A6L6X8Z3_9ACTN|nr:DUF397 domain-containing protein [Streptomyces typhae]MVO90348.1 DUF397 domain-containing protein [Streptomyces typhae]
MRSVPYENGVPASTIPSEQWIKSEASNGTGNCVELASLPDGGVALRNSRFPDGPALVFTAAEISAFVTGARAGDFDGLTASAA